MLSPIGKAISMTTVSGSSCIDISTCSANPAEITPEKSLQEIKKSGSTKANGSPDNDNRDSIRIGSGQNSSQENKWKTSYPPGNRKAPDGHELTREEVLRVLELEKRDREVRAHEQAHIAAGGRYVRSGASFQYETGPDGKRYAVGGEVSIDTTEEKDPEATIRKMETVRRAALAPAHPSSKDRKVAAEAQIKAQKAARELSKTQLQAGETRSYSKQGGSAGILEKTTGPDPETITGSAAPSVPGSHIDAYF